MSSLIVLGIDAGFTATGLTAIELGASGQLSQVIASKCVRTQPTKDKRAVRVADDDAERCMFLARAIQAFLQGWDPRAVVVELPGGGAQGARAIRAMALATGVVSAVLANNGYPVEWVTPQAVKKAATGRRDGSKEDVQQAVIARFDWGEQLPKTAAEREHVCDAAGAVMAAEHGALIQAVRQMGRGVEA